MKSTHKIIKFLAKHHKKVYTPKQLIAYLDLNKNTLESSLRRLWRHGFITYEPEKGYMFKIHNKNKFLTELIISISK